MGLKFITALERFFQGVPDIMRMRPYLYWALLILATIAIAPGVKYFQLDISEEFFFQTDDPAKINYQKYRAEFGGDESIYIVYRAKDGDIFSNKSLTAVLGIQQALTDQRFGADSDKTSPLDHIVEVITLINVSYLEASDDALVSRQFIGKHLIEDEMQREKYRKEALEHPDYPLMYLDESSEYGAILIRTDFKARTLESVEVAAAIEEGMEFDIDMGDIDFNEGGTASTGSVNNAKKEIPEFEAVEWSEYAVVINAINKILGQPEYTRALEFYPVGTPVLNAFIHDHFVPQINIVMSVTIMIVIIALWILFRSFSAVVWPILIFALSSLLTIAIMGWLGLKMNLMVNVTVLLCLVVGIADSVHIISGYLYFRNQGKDHQQALRLAYEKSGIALFLTSLTTSVGMLALWLVPIAPIQHFGLSAALAVNFAFLITVFMLPLMLDLWHPVSRKHAEKIRITGEAPHLISKLLTTVEHMSHSRPKVNVIVFGILALISMYGVTKVNVDSNQINIFAKDSSMRMAYDLVDSKMGGTNRLEVMIDTRVQDAFMTHRLLNAMETLQNNIEEEFPNTVTITHSLINVVKDSNKALHGGDDARYIIPETDNLIRQTLFLFNNANPVERSKVVSNGYDKAHITVNMVNKGSAYYVDTITRMQELSDKALNPLRDKYPDMEITLTGSLSMSAKIIDFLSWSQAKGFGVAFLIITVIMFFIFPPARTGLVAIIPNIFPILLVFGMMGYMGIPLDVDTLIVAPLMIGIVVDDTIHFLTHYRMEVSRHGDMQKAIVSTFGEVGQAITFTSIILSAAFASFMLLDHQGLVSFGLLSAIAIMAALSTELLLLPALLILAKIKA